MQKLKSVFAIGINYTFILSLFYFISINIITLILDYFNIITSLHQSVLIVSLLLLVTLIVGIKFVRVRLD